MSGKRKSTSTEDCREYRRFKYSEESLLEAVREVKEGMMSLSEASRVHNIPKGTLHNKVKNKVPMERKMGPATILTNEEERNVEKWIIRKAELGFPVHADDVKDSIRKLLIECPRKNPFTDNRPGDKWFSLFLRRHPEIVILNAIDYSKCISVRPTEINEETEESLPTFLNYSAAKDVIEHTIKEERLKIFRDHFKEGTYEIGDDRNLFFLWKTCVLKTAAGGTANCSSEESDPTQGMNIMAMPVEIVEDDNYNHDASHRCVTDVDILYLNDHCDNFIPQEIGDSLDDNGNCDRNETDDLASTSNNHGCVIPQGSGENFFNYNAGDDSPDEKDIVNELVYCDSTKDCVQYDPSQGEAVAPLNANEEKIKQAWRKRLGISKQLAENTSKQKTERYCKPFCITVLECRDTEEEKEKGYEEKQLIKHQRLIKRQEKRKEEQKIKEEKEEEKSEKMKKGEEKKQRQQNIKEEKEKEKSEREEIKKTTKPKKEKNVGEGNKETQETKQCEWKCPECDELFEDPPKEDWIQCSSCSLWWHENCTCYVKEEKFICDKCI